MTTMPYYILVDTAKAALESAVTQADCPDFHRTALQRVMDELDSIYGAAVSNAGIVD